MKNGGTDREREVRLDAAEVRRRVGSGWRNVLVRLGVPEESLGRENVPCPVCGGADRFSFDRRRLGNGDVLCRKCGVRDSFDLLMKFHRWTFPVMLREVSNVVGGGEPPAHVPTNVPEHEFARPTARVRDLLRTSCAPLDVPDVVSYLESRTLLPLPEGCSLRGHVGVPYFDGSVCIGRYPAIVAPVVDTEGDLVTAHVTHLERGRKLAGHEPRKLLGKLTGRRGCAVRLMAATDVLGIGEGVETCLAAWRLIGVPVWSCLNAGLLSKFEPPAGIERVIVFADRDAAGLEAAWKLRDRMACELRLPPAPSKDWADELARQTA